MLSNLTFFGENITDSVSLSIPINEFRILLVYPNLPLMLVPPLCIGIFTKVLDEQGYIVELFDTTSYMSEEGSSPQNRVKYLQARKFSDQDDLGITIKYDLLDDFRKKVLDFKPHLMIFSIVEDAFRKALRMLDVVSDLNIYHIIGGVFPTAAPDLCMEFPQIRMIGLGEGESTIVKVAEVVRYSGDLRTVPGTWFKDDFGKIHKNSQNPLVDINNSVPDFRLIEEARFYRPMGGTIFKTIPVETYRGCPYKCAFCNSPMQVTFAKNNDQGFFLRRKSMDVLRDELKSLINQFNPQFFYFIDDSFLARPPEEIDQFCDMYQEFGLPFWFNTRPENCKIDNLKRLKDVGCYRISFGIECGNESFRKKVLKRYVSNESLIKSFDLIADSGIPFSANLIIGFPGETRDLIMDTVEFVKLIHGYDTLTVSMFTPYHGTELREVAVKNGWVDPKSITVHTTSESMLTMPPPYVSKSDLNGLMRVLTLYCYFPKTEWDNIRRAEIDDEEGNRLLNIYSETYKKNFLKNTQYDLKEFVVESGTGCRSNDKDSLRFTVRLTQEEILMLTV